MMVIDRVARCFWGVSLIALSLYASPTERPRIVPLQATAKFLATAPKDRWSAAIKATDGNAAYVLSLEPDFDVGRHPVTLELLLHRAGDKEDAPNLLDPTGSVHGLQAYDFAANDLAKGVQESAFGKIRAVTLANLGLLVRINVLNAAVSRISGDDYQLDALDVQVDVDNLKH